MATAVRTRRSCHACSLVSLVAIATLLASALAEVEVAAGNSTAKHDLNAVHDAASGDTEHHASDKAEGPAAGSEGAAPGATTEPPAPIVALLGNKQFEEAIAKDRLMFVKFFSPRCPHCRAMKDDYIRLSREVVSQKVPVFIAEVDCTVEPNRQICEAHVPAGFPTLKVYEKGALVDEFTKVRDWKTMLGFLEKVVEFQTGPRVRSLETTDAVRNFLTEVGDRPVVMAMFGDDTDATIGRTWNSTVDIMREGSARSVAFALVTDSAVLQGSALGYEAMAKNFAAQWDYGVPPVAVGTPSAMKMADTGLAMWWTNGVTGEDTLETFMHVSTLSRSRGVLTPANAEFIAATRHPLAVVLGRGNGPNWKAEDMLDDLSRLHDLIPVYMEMKSLPRFREHLGYPELTPVRTAADFDALEVALYRAPGSGVEKLRFIPGMHNHVDRGAVAKWAFSYLKWGVNRTERATEVAGQRNATTVIDADGTEHPSSVVDVRASSWSKIVERDGRTVLLLLYHGEGTTQHSSAGSSPSQRAMPVFESTCASLRSSRRSIFCVRMDIGRNALPPYIPMPDKIPAVYALDAGYPPVLYNASNPASLDDAAKLSAFAMYHSLPPHLKASTEFQQSATADTTGSVVRLRDFLVGLFLMLGGAFLIGMSTSQDPSWRKQYLRLPDRMDGGLFARNGHSGAGPSGVKRR